MKAFRGVRAVHLRKSVDIFPNHEIAPVDLKTRQPAEGASIVTGRWKSDIPFRLNEGARLRKALRGLLKLRQDDQWSKS